MTLVICRSQEIIIVLMSLKLAKAELNPGIACSRPLQSRCSTIVDAEVV